MKILLLIFTVLFSANAFAGCDEGDCVNGKGKFTWAEGSVYEGDVYEGDWLDGDRTGKGKYTWASGGVYEGDFVKGDMTGKGKYTWADGEVEDGYWLDGELVETIAERERYDKILNACFLDKSSNVDIQVLDIKEAVKKSCEFIAKDPSLLEIWKYD